ncbi:hypothetical protein HAX54_022996 [Datura stramonium]|uniref:Uncharacterized protein n=1 Tax=Datura stramonium TaxID=4076 RepID=A0ABS8UXP8_DATST|nr:hypothetical protein [Datura stramonium]
MPKLSGIVKISGKVAYVPQSPWILTGNIKENILFGNLKESVNAVDAHTGTHLFQVGCSACLSKSNSSVGVLDEGSQGQDDTLCYTIVEFLPAADLILVMQNGRIAQAGIFEELLKQNIGFEVLVGAHNQALESILTVESSSRVSEQAITDGELDTDSNVNAEFPHTKQDSEHNLCIEITEKDGRLVQDEEREKGSIERKFTFT